MVIYGRRCRPSSAIHRDQSQFLQIPLNSLFIAEGISPPFDILRGRIEN